jgi:uncharacterized membrane protein YdbT with pleckstrin-like domain
MAPKLQPGERIIFEGRPSWRSILGFYIRGMLLTALAAFAVAIVTTLVDGIPDSSLVILIALAGVALTFLIGFVKREATRYTVTDRRLHIRRGILSRSVQETRIDRVQNVNCRQTIVQRLLGVGDVDFDTATGHEFEFTFAGVAGPTSIVHTVNGLPAAHASRSDDLGSA